MFSAKSVQEFLRGPTFLGISVGGGIIAAYSLAGVTNMPLAKIVLFATWSVFVIECYCSNWIRHFNKYRSSAVLLLAFVSGMGAVYVASDIASRKVMQESGKVQPEHQAVLPESAPKVETKDEPPLQQSPIVVRPQFKASGVFTPDIKRQITAQINLFYRYLTALGFKLPSEAPLIGITPGKVAESLFMQPGPFSESAIFIPTERLHDSSEVVSLYANWIFRDMFPYPLTPTGDEVGLGGRFNPYVQMLYGSYYTASFKNKYSYGADVDFVPVWMNALWDLRKRYGQDFVDRLMFYSYENGYPAPADATANDFLWSRFLGGLDAIDDNREHFADVMEIMRLRGLPRQRSSPQ